MRYLLLTLVILAACQPVGHANIIDRQGEKTGSAWFVERPDGVRIFLELWEMPAGEHAVHVHENGECKLPDFKSAGQHYAPFGKKHGFNHPEGPHAGDLPNIKVDEDGFASVTLHAPNLSLQPEKKGYIFPEGGTAIVVHAQTDDYITQPSGASGERIACGVIR